jgi:hypothetical protein
MEATHDAAMECLRRSAISDLLPELRDQNLKYGAKLLALYARQVEVLDKHRLRRQEYEAREIEARENAEPERITSIETVLIDPDPRRFSDRVDDGHLATPPTVQQGTAQNGAANGATHRAADQAAGREPPP